MVHWVLCIALAVALTGLSGIILFSGVFLIGIVTLGYRLWNDAPDPNSGQSR
jgi:hypothetical protein